MISQGWSMDSNSICHASPAKKIQCSFLEYVQLLMIGQDGLMDSNPICHPSPAKNMKYSFLDYVQLLMIGRAGRWTRSPCVPPLCSQKNEMPIFRLHSTSDDWPGWSMDSNPICHPSPAKKMKCSFLDYVQLLMISQAGRWTQTPSASHLQPKTWNTCFWITFNFWWSAGLVNGLKQHLQPLSSHKNEMLIFGLRSTSDDQLDWSMDSNAIHHPSPAINMKCLFLDYIQLLMIWPGWSMHSNPIYHLSPATKLKCSFLDYIQLLMIGRAGRWTQTPSTTSLRRQKWNAHFWIMFNFWWLARLVDGLKPHLQPLSSQKKLNAHFWITFNFWWLLGLINWLKRHPPPLSSQKHEMPIFTLHSNSDDKPGWSMDYNSICHASPAKKIQCSFLEYVQLLMIGQASWWTQTPSATPLQPKNEILIFGIRSTSDDWPGWSMDSNPICHLSPAKKIKCSF